MAKQKPKTDAGAAYRRKGSDRVQTIGVAEERVILRCLRVGGSRTDAMKLIGRSGSVADLMMLGDTTKRHPDFKARIEKAEAEGKHHHLQKLYKGDDQWRASAWMLERKWWREFAARTPDSFTREQMLMLMLSLSQVINDVVKDSTLRKEIDTRLSDLLAGLGLSPAKKTTNATE
jgi:hypothetical protein